MDLPVVGFVLSKPAPPNPAWVRFVKAATEIAEGHGERRWSDAQPRRVRFVNTGKQAILACSGSFCQISGRGGGTRATQPAGFVLYLLPLGFVLYLLPPWVRFVLASLGFVSYLLPLGSFYSCSLGFVL